MRDEDLDKLFGNAQITPDEAARQKAKKRMLNSLETKGNSFLRRINMDIQENSKKIFRVTKQHLQGAVAMLLVFALAISTLALTPGVNLFGTLFEGYEDAAEQPIVVDPGSIEASKDYSGGTFTLDQLPIVDLSKIKPEHFFLGGYFEGLAVQGLEVVDDDLIVTIAKTEGGEGSGDVSFNSDGYIAISPEAFNDNSSYYLGTVTVAYPALVSDLEAIDRDDDGNISQKMTLTLENDSFLGSISASDVVVTGLDSYSLNGFTAAGNSLSFTLAGKNNDYEGASFSISGDKLAKGLDVQLTIGVGRVPMPIQASTIDTGVSTQTLDIFLDYDSFTEDISLSMLTFGGVMNEFQVTSLVRVDHRNIELELRGTVSKPGTGTVQFDSAAVVSGRHGRVCEISVTDPNAEENSYESIDYSEEIGLEEIGLMDAGIEIPGFVTSIAKEIATSIVKAVVKKAVKAVGESMGINMDDEKDMLKKVLSKLDTIEADILALRGELASKFNKLSYSVTSETVGTQYDKVMQMCNLHEQKNEDLDGEDLEYWYDTNMVAPVKLSGNEDFFSLASSILDRLDPNPPSDALKRESLIVLFEKECKTNLPFEHNVFIAMMDYINGWDSDFARILDFSADVLDYNYGVISDPAYRDLENTVHNLCKQYIRVRENIDEYISTRSYTEAYGKLYATEYATRYVEDEYIMLAIPNSTFYLVANDTGLTYTLSDPLNNPWGAVSNKVRDGRSIIKDKYYLVSSAWMVNGRWYNIGMKQKSFKTTLLPFSMDGRIELCLNELFNKYIVDIDGKELWFFDSHPKNQTYLYCQLKSRMTVFDSDSALSMDMNEHSFYELVKTKAKDMFNLKSDKGVDANTYFIVLMGEER